MTATEVDEAEEVVGVVLVAHNQPAVVAQPGEQPLDLVAPEPPAILCDLPVSAIRWQAPPAPTRTSHPVPRVGTGGGTYGVWYGGD